MKIAVDAGCLGIQDERLKVGVYTVVKNLLMELGKIDKKNQYLLYTFFPIEKGLMKKFGKNMQNIVLPAQGWLKLILPMRMLLDKPDIFIAANQAMPFRLPFTTYRTLGIFYDIAFEKYPKLYSYAASVNKHKKNSRRVAKNADSILAISHSTKKDVERIYAIPPRKVVVAYPGIEMLQNNAAYRHKNPYFLFVGASKKTKNIPLLLKAFAFLQKNYHHNYDLLLAGGDKWLDPEIKQIIDTFSPKIREHIHFLGFVSSNMLAALYKGAFAFVSPSLYEGFGLPFLEAQSVGIPVIASSAGSMPEIIGKSGILVNPKSPHMLVKAMHSLIVNKVLHKELVARGRKNVKKYSWKIFARQVQSALQNLS